MKGYLPDQTRITQVHLRTNRLQPVLGFYTDVLGLHASRAQDGRAVLSTMPHEPGLIVLSEEPKASPRPPRAIGLYHVALRYPNRRDLARVYRRVFKAGYPVAGASDHGVSEAIYLSDPDGNGVELYADRPRSQWRREDGMIAMTTTPLDLGGLLALLAAEPPMNEPPPRAEIGHIHLHVANLGVAERFYSEFLGFAVTQRSYPGSLFLAAGDYHHHLGVNVWAGKTVPPANSVGLVSYRIEVPVSEILYCLGHRAPLLGYETRTGSEPEAGRILQIRDPNGTWLEVQASHNAVLAGPGSFWAKCPDEGVTQLQNHVNAITE